MHLQAKKSDILHVSMQLDFCYITDVGGPLCWVPTAVSEVCPAFLLICLTTHTCLRAVQKTWGVEGWGGGVGWGGGLSKSQKAAAACHTEQVCVVRD